MHTQTHTHREGFLGGSDGKESVCNAGDLCSIHELGRSPEEEMATHSSVLAWRTPMDRGAWWSVSHGVAELDTTERLSTQHAHTHTHTHTHTRKMPYALKAEINRGDTSRRWERDQLIPQSQTFGFQTMRQ